MNIQFADENRLPEEFTDVLEKAATLCLEGEGVDAGLCNVSVSFVTLDRIRELNREFRDTDRATDVLSFPQFDSVEELRSSGAMMGFIEVGDVVICIDRAKEQANEFGHSFERELVYLFVHSIYHLLGYDHMDEADKKIMRSKEEQVMNRLGIVRECETHSCDCCSCGSEDGNTIQGCRTESENPVQCCCSDLVDMPKDVEKNDDIRDLLRVLYMNAREAAKNAYAPYSGYKVGAALLAESGIVYPGANVENASYGGSICAERVACTKAVSEGERNFIALAIYADAGAAKMCGICRQFLSEFDEDLLIVTGEDEDNLVVQGLNELLPDGFGSKELE